MLSIDKLKHFVNNNVVAQESIEKFLDDFTNINNRLLFDLDDVQIGDESMHVLFKEFVNRKYKIVGTTRRINNILVGKKDLLSIKYIFSVVKNIKSPWTTWHMCEIIKCVIVSKDNEFLKKVCAEADRFYFTELHESPILSSCAINNNNIEALKILLSCGCDVNGVPLYLTHRKSIIFEAVANLEIFAFLFDHPQIDTKNHSSQVLVNKVIINGSSDVLGFILNNPKYHNNTISIHHLIYICKEHSKPAHMIEIQKYIERRKIIIVEVTEIYGPVVNIINNYF